MTIEEIERLLSSFKLDNLECDGATRVIHTILFKNKIQHTVWFGYASYNEKKIVHFWITYDKYIIDYKSKMWFGEIEDVKQGVFLDEDTSVFYDGKPTNLETLSDKLLDILLT